MSYPSESYDPNDDFDAETACRALSERLDNLAEAIQKIHALIEEQAQVRDRQLEIAYRQMERLGERR